MDGEIKKSFSERFRSKNNRPKPAAPTRARVPKTEEKFVRITVSQAARLFDLEHVCWPLFAILWFENLRHHGRAFVLPTEALTTIPGLSPANLRKNLDCLEACGLIAVQRQPPKPPIAPTRPVTVPVCVGKYCGTSLNTAPFPTPSNAAHPSAPTSLIPAPHTAFVISPTL